LAVGTIEDLNVAEHRAIWELLCNLDHAAAAATEFKPRCSACLSVEEEKYGAFSYFECHIKSAQSGRVARCVFEVKMLI
jgi:hypothetical protein